VDLTELTERQNRGMIAFDLVLGTELLTDVVWAHSPAIRRPFSPAALRLAGVGNLAMAMAYAAWARRS
jgi:hypothetical protein